MFSSCIESSEASIFWTILWLIFYVIVRYYLSLQEWFRESSIRFIYFALEFGCFWPKKHHMGHCFVRLFYYFFVASFAILKSVEIPASWLGEGNSPIQRVVSCGIFPWLAGKWWQIRCTIVKWWFIFASSFLLHFPLWPAHQQLQQDPKGCL